MSLRFLERQGGVFVRNLTYDSLGRLNTLTDGSLYNFTLGYAPDSNILTGNDSINGNWTYTYDDFGRLSNSSQTGQAFNYKYDRYGNRWQQNVTTGSGPNPSYTFDSHNHLTAVGSPMTRPATSPMTASMPTPTMPRATC